MEYLAYHNIFKCFYRRTEILLFRWTNWQNGQLWLIPTKNWTNRPFSSLKVLPFPRSFISFSPSLRYQSFDFQTNRCDYYTISKEIQKDSYSLPLTDNQLFKTSWSFFVTIVSIFDDFLHMINHWKTWVCRWTLIFISEGQFTWMFFPFFLVNTLWHRVHFNTYALTSSSSSLRKATFFWVNWKSKHTAISWYFFSSAR